MLDLDTTLASIGETVMARPNITTEEEALAAVRKRGRSLRYMPLNIMTPEICFEAVKNLLEKDLKIVPEALRDEMRQVLKSGV
jgi:hypothetical protein